MSRDIPLMSTATATDVSCLTVDKLLATRELLKGLTGPRHFDTLIGGGNFRKRVASQVEVLSFHDEPRNLRLNSVMGFSIREIPGPALTRPVLKISKDFEYCSPEFRAAWDAWALERFGTEEVCYLMDSSVLAELSNGIRRDIERRVVKCLLGES